MYLKIFFYRGNNFFKIKFLEFLPVGGKNIPKIFIGLLTLSIPRSSGELCRLPSQYASVFSSFSLNPEIYPKLLITCFREKKDVVFFTKVVRSPAKTLSFISSLPTLIPIISLFSCFEILRISQAR